VGFDVGESDGGVRNELAEVLHDHPLGQDRLFAERTVGEALVEAPVEGRAGVGVLAQAMQRPTLILLEPLARPVVPLAQRQDLEDDLRAHRVTGELLALRVPFLSPLLHLLDLPLLGAHNVLCELLYSRVFALLVGNFGHFDGRLMVQDHGVDARPKIQKH
jgi:hypothetical protein